VGARRLVLLRHGRTAWNAERRYQGQADPPLDSVGQAQAMQVAGLIAAMHPDLLIASDLLRCRQTVEPIIEMLGRPALFDERLRERHLGHWQGLTREEVQSRYPEEFADWISGRDVFASRGGESRQQVADRALAVVAQLPPVELIVLVSHGATSMCLAAAMLGLPQNPSILAPLANCHWTELRDVGSGWTLRAHNAGAPGLVVPLLTPDADSGDAEA